MPRACASLAFSFVGPGTTSARRARVIAVTPARTTRHYWERRRRDRTGCFAPGYRAPREQLPLPVGVHTLLDWRPVAAPVVDARPAKVVLPVAQPPCSSCPRRSACRAACPELEAMLKREHMPPEIVEYKERTKSPDLTIHLANLRHIEQAEPEPDDNAPRRVPWNDLMVAVRPVLDSLIDDPKVLTLDQRHVVKAVLSGKRPAQIAREYQVTCKAKQHDEFAARGATCPVCHRVARDWVGVKKPTISVMLKRARRKLEAAILRVFQGRFTHPVLAVITGGQVGEKPVENEEVKTRLLHSLGSRFTHRA